MIRTSNHSSALNNQSVNEVHKSIGNTFMSSNVMESFSQDDKTIKLDNGKDKISITKPRSRDIRQETQRRIING